MRKASIGAMGRTTTNGALLLALLLTACGSDPAGSSTDGAGDASGAGDAAHDGAPAPDVADGSTSDTPAPKDTFVEPADTCVPKSGNPLLLRIRGTIWTGKELIQDGEVFTNATTQKIVCVGQDCSAAPDADKATIVCTNGVVTPGLINPHAHANYDHLPRWKHEGKLFKDRYQWQADASYHSFKKPQETSFTKARCEVMKWAELRQLVSGTTSLQGTSGGPCINGWVRDLDDTKGASGINGYEIDTQVTKISGAKAADAAKWAAGLKGGTLAALVLHLGEGVDDLSKQEWYDLVKLGLATPGVALIHGTGLTGVELAEARQKNVKLIWSPQSNLDLYGDTTRVPAALNMGMTVALGPDWTPSGEMNQLDEMKCAKALSDKRWGGVLTDEKLVRMVTVDAALAMGAQDDIGALKPGMYADVAVFAGDRKAPFAAVVQSRPETVRLVVIGGRPLYGDTSVVSAIAAPGCEPLDVCGVAKTVCVKDPNVDTGDQSLADLKAKLEKVLGDAKTADKPAPAYEYAYQLWPLYFCGPAADDLIRCDTKGAAPSAADLDGDGKANEADDCPSVWNPDQGNVDGDALGDACDPCPLLKDGTDCPAPSADDQDGDGVKDGTDDCATTFNPDQKDADSDGKGDACDECPTAANPGPATCPALAAAVTEVNADGKTFPDGTSVELKGLVVTAISPGKSAADIPKVWAQTSPGVPNGGILLQLPKGAKVSVVIGQQVNAKGKVGNAFGLKLLDAVTLSPGAQVGEPVPLAVAATVLAAEPGAIPYRSLLVEVPDAKVKAANADDPKDFGEVLLEGGLRLDDMFLVWGTTMPRPKTGDTFSAIRGILTWTFSQEKIEPRTPADFVK